VRLAFVPFFRATADPAAAAGYPLADDTAQPVIRATTPALLTAPPPAAPAPEMCCTWTMAARRLSPPS